MRKSGLPAELLLGNCDFLTAAVHLNLPVQAKIFNREGNPLCLYAAVIQEQSDLVHPRQRERVSCPISVAQARSNDVIARRRPFRLRRTRFNHEYVRLMGETRHSQKHTQLSPLAQ